MYRSEDTTCHSTKTSAKAVYNHVLSALRSGLSDVTSHDHTTATPRVFALSLSLTHILTISITVTTTHTIQRTTSSTICQLAPNEQDSFGRSRRPASFHHEFIIEFIVIVIFLFLFLVLLICIVLLESNYVTTFIFYAFNISCCKL